MRGVRRVSEAHHALVLMRDQLDHMMEEQVCFFMLYCVVCRVGSYLCFLCLMRNLYFFQMCHVDHRILGVK